MCIDHTNNWMGNEHICSLRLRAFSIDYTRPLVVILHFNQLVLKS